MIERMLLFGASGDLTKRLLLPAVAQLAEAGLLPPGFTIVGSSNVGWSTDDFRQHIANGLEQFAPVTPATRDAVVKMLSFQPADVTRPEEISRLIGGESRPDTLVYLALPPFLFEPVLLALAKIKCASRTRWRSRNLLELTWRRRNTSMRSSASSCRSRRSSGLTISV